ncbi:hypothetical protein ACWGHM_03020 [Streptomyces sp. NPDC054904]|uniref:hypothetical protein n=1 Tax=unclassified Streptomyces TaxID=2593676 RepID=UPI0029BB292B|nr:hypothetical protein [Streptomyces sp. DK15]MDX2388811.1 hypothetical protein [Streptomyces sp. DK15]
MSNLWGHGGAYQTWTQYLRDWSNGGAAATAEAAARLPTLRPDDYHQDTWARFSQHLTDAFDRRLRDWAKALTAALEAARDEFEAGRALVQARTGLDAVRALAAHPALPEDLRERLAELVEGQITGFQEQLEASLDRAARGGSDPRLLEDRRRTVRENPLTTAGPGTPGPGKGRPAPAPGEGWSYDPAAPARRRIITD